MNGCGVGSGCTSGSSGRRPKRRWPTQESWASRLTRPTGVEIPDWVIGVSPVVLYCNVPLQTKDSQQRDTLASSATTSPCTYAVEPPCTGRYARLSNESIFIMIVQTPDTYAVTFHLIFQI